MNFEHIITYCLVEKWDGGGDIIREGTQLETIEYLVLY